MSSIVNSFLHRCSPEGQKRNEAASGSNGMSSWLARKASADEGSSTGRLLRGFARLEGHERRAELTAPRSAMIGAAKSTCSPRRGAVDHDVDHSQNYLADAARSRLLLGRIHDGSCVEPDRRERPPSPGTTYRSSVYSGSTEQTPMKEYPWLLRSPSFLWPRQTECHQDFRLRHRLWLDRRGGTRTWLFGCGGLTTDWMAAATPRSEAFRPGRAFHSAHTGSNGVC